MKTIDNATQPAACLPFGNADAVVDTTLNAFGDRISRAVVGGVDIGLATGSRQLSHKANSITFGKISLTALAFTPIHINRNSVTKRTIVIPFSGDLNMISGRNSFMGQAGKTGLFCSGEARCGTSFSGVSELLVELDDDYLLEVAQAMAGADQKTSMSLFALDRNRALPLNINGISFANIFNHHCRLVDSLFHQPGALAMTGADNAFYRNFVALLAPEFVFGVNARPVERRSKERDVLNPLCEYIQANLKRPIYLTDLEKMSGLSARSLQYAFGQRFNCSPMDWVRQERLGLAHSMFIAAEPYTTVTSVSYSVGFNNLSMFASSYRQRFGELPSVTLARALEE
jgi:AraC-like DNA-binding protein